MHKIKKLVLNNGFLFNRHKPSALPNVLLFSLPRSGSTWLLELIWSQPEFKYVNEPLNLKGSWLRKKSHINGFKELYTEAVRDKVVAYFKGFVEGKYHFMNPNPSRKNSRFFTSRIVFKVIHGGEFLINDIAEHTNSKIVYLLRNPIAVALSRTQIPRTEELTSDFVLSRFTPDEQNFAKEIIRNGSDMEKKIMLWCIQNKLALHHRTSNWLVISYERLTCYPEKVLTALAEHCKLPDLETMIQRVSIPSAVSTQSDDDSVSLMQEDSDNRKRLINKWKSKVTEAEMHNYFEICYKMNIGIYTEDSDFINLKEVL
jgi:hypothetical protein